MADISKDLVDNPLPKQSLSDLYVIVCKILIKEKRVWKCNNGSLRAL